MRKYTTMVNTRIFFIIILIIMYVSFLTLDVTGGSIKHSINIKFTVVIICFCYALYSKCNNKSISYTIKTALLFTLISDFFILLLDNFLYGVLTFIIVQLLYNYRICLYKSRVVSNKIIKEARRSLIGWVLIQLITSTSLCYIIKEQGVELELLLIASVIYFIGILINTIRAIKVALNKADDKGMLLFAAGLFLFLLCDINVGLFNLSQFIVIPQGIDTAIYNTTSVLMWAFYAPSQALIALSINKSI